MKNLFRKFIERKRCEFLVAETDLIEVLSILDTKKINNYLHIGKFSWEQENKWRFVFKVTAQRWDTLVREFKKKCSKEILVPTEDSFGNVFYQQI